MSASSVPGPTPDPAGDPDHSDAHDLPPSGDSDGPAPECGGGRSRDLPRHPDDAARLWAEIWHEALQAGFVETSSDDVPPDRR